MTNEKETNKELFIINGNVVKDYFGRITNGKLYPFRDLSESYELMINNDICDINKKIVSNKLIKKKFDYILKIMGIKKIDKRKSN